MPNPTPKPLLPEPLPAPEPPPTPNPEPVPKPEPLPKPGEPIPRGALVHHQWERQKWECIIPGEQGYFNATSNTLTTQCKKPQDLLTNRTQECGRCQWAGREAESKRPHYPRLTIVHPIKEIPA